MPTYFSFTESIVEEAALGWLESLGYAVLLGPDIAVGEPAAERSDPNYRDVALEGRLQQALARLNPDLPAEALEDAYRKLSRTDAPLLLERNRAVPAKQEVGAGSDHKGVSPCLDTDRCRSPFGTSRRPSVIGKTSE